MLVMFVLSIVRIAQYSMVHSKVVVDFTAFDVWDLHSSYKSMQL